MARKGKMIRVEMTALEAIDQCACTIEELAEEMGSWRDGMEEKLSHTEKYERVSEAADALENSEVRSAVDSVESAIEELEGKPFKPGCPEHVLGQKCSRCGWNGVARKPSYEPELLLKKPIMESYRTGNGDRLVVAKVREGYGYRVYDVPKGASEAEIEGERLRAKTYFDELHAKWVENNAPEKLIRSRLPDTPELLPLEELQGIGETKCAWQELQPYKGRSLSRADRLGEATQSGRAGLDSMREAVEKYAEAHKGEEEEDERVVALREALDELEGAIEELENGVDFPGMYG